MDQHDCHHRDGCRGHRVGIPLDAGTVIADRKRHVGSVFRRARKRRSGLPLLR